MNGSFDIAAIQRALPPLSEMFERDNHTTKRAGQLLFVCCPFHEEKSPSCQINDATGKFHCFGCKASGDIFDYWQKSRDLDFREALASLAGLVGLGPTSTPLQKSTPKPKPKPTEKPIAPLTGDDLAQWIHATEYLSSNEAQIERIANWRGIEPACIKWAADQGLMGLFPYYGTEREAFLVERPHEGSLLPVSVHVRLAPHTQGNPQPKQSWRFTPSGCGSWPFVIGDLTTAKRIFLMEGQWDALAMVSIMRWHALEEEKWPDIAIVGLRGASGHTTFLAHEINPKAHIIAIADADGAGAGWFEEKGLLDRLHTRVRRVTGYWPTTHKTDFNDLVKAGEITRDIMLSYLLPKTTLPIERSSGPTFLQWCKRNTGRPAPIGPAARFFVDDKTRPAGRRPLPALERYWRKRNVPTETLIDLGIAWNTYRTECRTPA